METGEYEKTIELLFPHATSGDAEAQFWLGYLYLNYAECCSAENAFKWLKKAAAQDYPDACYYLATSSQDEEDSLVWGIPESEEQRDLLRYAAKLGSADAQKDLGCFLCLGEYGFEKDEIQGRYWYLEAAKQGHSCAQYTVGLMFLEGDGGEPHQEQGLYWLEQSAASEELEPESEWAARVLSEIYEQGLFEVPQNPKRAEDMRQRARELDTKFKERYADSIEVIET